MLNFLKRSNFKVYAENVAKAEGTFSNESIYEKKRNEGGKRTLFFAYCIE